LESVGHRGILARQGAPRATESRAGCTESVRPVDSTERVRGGEG
jgi:hypothetical protein